MNARIFCSDFQFHQGAFAVSAGGKFGIVLGEAPEYAIDLEGATVIPGLIEVHAYDRGLRLRPPRRSAEGHQFNLGGQMAEIRGGVAKLVCTVRSVSSWPVRKYNAK